MMDLMNVLGMILLGGGVLTAVVFFGWVVWDRIASHEDMALRDCGPQDPGAPVSFQLHLLWNELCELHSGKQVGNTNSTVLFICQMAKSKHQWAPKVPDIRDQDLQTSPQARESLADWLHAFSLCLDTVNQKNCCVIEDALRAW